MQTQQHCNRTASIHPRAYSLAQVAAILGIHRATVHRLVQAGKLRAISGFGVLKVSDFELDRFLSATTEYKPVKGKAVASVM
ncbi:MAG: helix-turn-helix domain-containing protein [Chthoniobacterales bacterium]